MAFSFTIGDSSRLKDKSQTEEERREGSEEVVELAGQTSSSSSSCEWGVGGSQVDSWEEALDNAQKEPPKATEQKKDANDANAQRRSQASELSWTERESRRRQNRVAQYAQWEAYIQNAWNSPPDDPIQSLPTPPAPTASMEIHPSAANVFLRHQRHTSPFPQGPQSKALAARVATKSLHATFGRLPKPNTPPKPQTPSQMFRPSIRDDSEEDMKSPPRMSPNDAWRAESLLLPPPLQPLPLPPPPESPPQSPPPTGMMNGEDEHLAGKRKGREDGLGLGWGPGRKGVECAVADLLGLGITPTPHDLSAPPLLNTRQHHHPFDILD